MNFVGHMHDYPSLKSSYNQSLFSRNLVSSPACSCGHPCENISHFLLHCPNYTQQRNNLFGNLKTLIGFITDLDDLSDDILVHLLLIGSSCLSTMYNAQILLYVQTFLLVSNRFL